VSISARVPVASAKALSVMAPASRFGRRTKASSYCFSLMIGNAHTDESARHRSHRTPAIASPRATANGPATRNTPRPGIARLAKPAKVPSNTPPYAAPIDRSRNLSEPLRGGSSAGSVPAHGQLPPRRLPFRRARVLSEPIASRELSLIITHSLQDPYRDLTRGHRNRCVNEIRRRGASG
jgi:hypothetical protein